MSGIKHGYTAYTRGCRCEVCREAKRRYMSARRSTRRMTDRIEVVEPITKARWLIAPIEKHGTRYGYEERGCRCAACCAAHAASHATHRGGTVPTSRRVTSGGAL